MVIPVESQKNLQFMSQMALEKWQALGMSNFNVKKILELNTDLNYPALEEYVLRPNTAQAQFSYKG